jgi:hypothetical protein
MDNLIRLGLISVLVVVLSVFVVYLIGRIASLGYFKTKSDYDQKLNKNNKTNQKEK